MLVKIGKTEYVASINIEQDLDREVMNNTKEIRYVRVAFTEYTPK